MGQFFASLVDTQEVQHFDPREFIAQDDKVVALGHYAWRVKSTGREFGGDFAHVFTVHNGKVIRFHEYMDTAAAAAAHRRDKYDDEAGALYNRKLHWKNQQDNVKPMAEIKALPR